MPVWQKSNRYQLGWGNDYQVISVGVDHGSNNTYEQQVGMSKCQNFLNFRTDINNGVVCANQKQFSFE